ncbi:HlyD family type I secretion periplasmic adaptor subunit [Sphingobium aromaticiconvertens]|uniref:HlyD family type I secretion periplasmic adaptor subunit n=1 Tax=Sphingobium aromaticiconvertens TaxID=365341 RepID=UPI0030168E0C
MMASAGAIRVGRRAGDTWSDPEIRLRQGRRWTFILLGTALFGLGGASALVPVGGAVIGSGQVGAESRIKRIAHPLGGTVAEILVSDGQRVEKGQPLLRLDDRVSGADAAFSTLTLDQMLAQKARLEAERTSAAAWSFPAELAARKDESAMRAKTDEQRIFHLRQQEVASLAAQSRARIGQYAEQIAGYRAQIAALRQQSRLIAPEMKGIRDLYEKKLVTLGRLNQLERTAVDLDGNVAMLQAQIAQTEARISETREQLIQLGQTRRTEAAAQLAQLNEALNQQRIRSVSASDAHDRSVLRAPYAGVVEKLAATTIGGVIRPAETIMEIVPDRDSLLVEGSVSPDDIDQVRVGQPVRIRFSTLSRTVTPEVTGVITYVASERVTDANGLHAYFPVRVSLSSKNATEAEQPALKRGMPAEIFIETGDRTLLSFLTRPLRDQFARAFRAD